MTQQKFSYDSFARPLFSSRVAMAWADPRAPMPRLIGDEVRALEQVTATRAREFAAGRLAARRAMEMLGHIGRPVLQGDDLAPVWPPGLTGSITHSDRDSLAVVTDDPEILALGLALDPVTPLDPACWPICCTMTEMQWLASLGPSQRGHFARLIENAKTAVFKAHHERHAEALDFQQINLRIDLSSGRFEATICSERTKAEPSIAGSFAILSDSFISAVEIAQAA
jgi:4'-phosphopantetheinyl transferase EntD